GRHLHHRLGKILGEAGIVGLVAELLARLDGRIHESPIGIRAVLVKAHRLLLSGAAPGRPRAAPPGYVGRGQGRIKIGVTPASSSSNPPSSSVVVRIWIEDDDEFDDEDDSLISTAGV